MPCFPLFWFVSFYLCSPFSFIFCCDLSAAADSACLLEVLDTSRNGLPKLYGSGASGSPEITSRNLNPLTSTLVYDGTKDWQCALQSHLGPNSRPVSMVQFGEPAVGVLGRLKFRLALFDLARRVPEGFEIAGFGGVAIVFKRVDDIRHTADGLNIPGKGKKITPMAIITKQILNGFGFVFRDCLLEKAQTLVS